MGQQHQGVDDPSSPKINHHYTQLAFHDLRDGATRLGGEPTLIYKPLYSP
jgi:hypothetical protein